MVDGGLARTCLGRRIVPGAGRAQTLLQALLQRLGCRAALRPNQRIGPQRLANDQHRQSRLGLSVGARVTGCAQQGLGAACSCEPTVDEITQGFLADLDLEQPGNCDAGLGFDRAGHPRQRTAVQHRGRRRHQHQQKQQPRRAAARQGTAPGQPGAPSVASTVRLATICKPRV